MRPNNPGYNLLVILGPTASGKTRLAVSLARELGGEIISADSRQVFRGMDIGSGKDLHEYGQVPYHMIDILNAGEEFSVFLFQQLFLEIFEQLSQRTIIPVLCGGSGMYLDAALRGYRLVQAPQDEDLRAELAGMNDQELSMMLRALKPNQHNSTDLRDRQRTVRAIEIACAERDAPQQSEPYPSICPLVIGIHFDKQQIHQRIRERLLQRLDNGLIEEVQQLRERGIPWERLDYYGLEYRYVGAFLRGKMCRNDLLQKLCSAIQNFAKRQANWYRRMESHGTVIHWVNGEDDPLRQALEIVRSSSFVNVKMMGSR